MQPISSIESLYGALYEQRTLKRNPATQLRDIMDIEQRIHSLAVRVQERVYRHAYTYMTPENIRTSGI